MEKIKSKNFNVKFMVEDIVGCKWSTSILDLLEKGVNRPGAIAREIEGLSTKVLNERLRKLLKYKIIAKLEFDEVPPKVEYIFTDFGKKFLKEGYSLDNRLTILKALNNKVSKKQRRDL